MKAERHPVWTLLDGIQMDDREIERLEKQRAAKLVSLRSFVSGLGLGEGPGPEVCEECGLGRGRHLTSCSVELADTDVAVWTLTEATEANRRANAVMAARLARGAAAEGEES